MPPVQHLNQKITVCGHNHYGFVHAIAAGFNSLEGIQANHFCHQHVAYSKARSSSFFRRLRYRGKSQRLNDQILRAVDDASPDLVVIIEGSCATPETVCAMRAHRPVVLWCLDSLHRLRPPKEQLEAYDRVFTFEPKDREIWPVTVYLPIGYNDHVYRPLPGVKKEYDLVWVGSAHADRLERLNSVAGIAQELGMRFGVFGPIFKDKHRGRFSASHPNLFQCIVQNRGISPDEANQIYNSSLLAVNFHSDKDHEAAYNPRTWEASAAGSIIVTDWKDAMNGEVLDGENAFVYRSMDDLKRRLPEILEDKSRLEAIRLKAQKDARERHTFASRARSLLDYLSEHKTQHV